MKFIANVSSARTSQTFSRGVRDSSRQLLKPSTLLILAGALALGTLSFGCADKQPAETTGQYVDDTAVTAKVKSALLGDETVKSLAITVVTTGGVVQLTGVVGTADQKTAAEKIASGVAGVKSVKNDLSVK